MEENGSHFVVEMDSMMASILKSQCRFGPKRGDTVRTKFGDGMVTDVGAMALSVEMEHCAASILRTDCNPTVQGADAYVLREIEPLDLD